MLPWEHAAVAYLLYSGYARWRYDAPPAGWPVLVVLVASQVPDLIGKPLAWQFGLLPTGRSLIHSVFVAVPVSATLCAVARQCGKSALGPAFAIGYLSHLATDAVPLYPNASPSVESILWPVLQYEPESPHSGGFLERTVDILFRSSPSLSPGALAPSVDLVVGIGISGLVIGLWIADGTPGVRETGTVARWPLTALRR